MGKKDNIGKAWLKANPGDTHGELVNGYYIACQPKS